VFTVNFNGGAKMHCLIDMERKLLHCSEEKISYLQIIGFAIILAGLVGLVYLFVEQLPGKINASTSGGIDGKTQNIYETGGGIIAIDFFAIMLGFAFAFPDLLRDSNKGLSTMRIVVFMMINVICILLLKIGWGQPHLKDIGLDQYWMGVIAFVFGAKATQTYFESKLSVPPAAPPPPSPQGELDGCGLPPAKLTTDAGLPVSKGGMA
jgi:drug/metabolite transporter (DMT)-like permease